MSVLLDVVHTLQTVNFQIFNWVLQEFRFRGLLNSRLSAKHKKNKNDSESKREKNLFMLQLLLL